MVSQACQEAGLLADSRYYEVDDQGWPPQVYLVVILPLCQDSVKRKAVGKRASIPCKPPPPYSPPYTFQVGTKELKMQTTESRFLIVLAFIHPRKLRTDTFLFLFFPGWDRVKRSVEQK